MTSIVIVLSVLLQVPLLKLALGTQVEVVVDGKTYTIKIPARTRDGAMLRLAGVAQGRDLIITVRAEPRPATSEAAS